jgi:glutathione S-transferase
VPSGLLPVLDLDGRIVTESGVIMNLLEDAFPDHKPLMPPKGSGARRRADALMRLERRFFSAWLEVGAGVGGAVVCVCVCVCVSACVCVCVCV